MIIQSGALSLVNPDRRGDNTRTGRFTRPGTSNEMTIRILLIVALLIAGLGIATNIGSSSTASDEIIWVDIPAFPNSPLVTSLMRSGTATEGVNYDIVLATPEFFEAVNRSDDIIRTSAYFSVVFLLVEYHYHDGLHMTYSGTLTVDGSRYSRPVPLPLSDDGHNRITALMFPDLSSSMLNEVHTFEIPLPPDETGNHQVLTWETPIVLPAAPTQSGG